AIGRRGSTGSGEAGTQATAGRPAASTRHRNRFMIYVESGRQARREPARAMGLLVLDVEGYGAEGQYLVRAEQARATARVVLVEELEPGELRGRRAHHGPVRVPLEARGSPTVHVQDDLDARVLQHV